MQVHRRDRLTDSSIVQPSQQRYGCVRTSAPFSVTTRVCSNWAHRLPSAVSTVQPSSHMYQSPAPKGDHRLDGEGHPRLDHRVVARLVVVRDDQAGMKGGVYAVSGVVPDHAVAEALDVAFDHPSDDVHLAARLDGLDRADQRLVGAFGEQPAGLIDLAAEEGCAGVAVYAADVGGDVDLDDVAVLERTSIGDAVADDLIDRRAAGLRESAIAKRRGICVVLDQIFVDHLIKIIGRYPGLDDRGRGMHGLCSEPACDPHLLDDLVRLDVVAGVGIGRESPHIMRPRNAGWHLTRGETVAGWMVTSRSYDRRKWSPTTSNSAELMWLMTAFRGSAAEEYRRDASVRRSPKEGEMAEGDWWFDLETHQVVPDNNDTKVTDRLGPYKTREEAERALERVEERNEEYDNDPRWNDDL